MALDCSQLNCEINSLNVPFHAVGRAIKHSGKANGDEKQTKPLQKDTKKDDSKNEKTNKINIVSQPPNVTVTD